MAAFLPGKTAKQIQDKRRGAAYKNLLQLHLSNSEAASTLPMVITEEDEDTIPRPFETDQASTTASRVD
jgi:hypothetical protein